MNSQLVDRAFETETIVEDDELRNEADDLWVISSDDLLPRLRRHIHPLGSGPL